MSIGDKYPDYDMYCSGWQPDVRGASCVPSRVSESNNWSCLLLLQRRNHDQPLLLNESFFVLTDKKRRRKPNTLYLTNVAIQIAIQPS